MQPIQNLLLCVGAMKSGTTWLYKNLQNHPDIFFTPEKEIHYFSYISGFGNKLSYQNRQAKKDKARNHDDWYGCFAEPVELNNEWYINLFPDNVRSSSCYCADFSNQYALLEKESYQLIKDVSFNRKVLYVLRDPFERLWSHIKFQYKFVGDEEGAKDIRLEDVKRLVEKKWFWKNCLYAQNYEKLSSVFQEDLILLHMEDFLTYPKAALNNLQRSLMLRPPTNLFSEKKKVNPTKSYKPRNDVECYLKENLLGEYEKCFNLGIHHASWDW